MFSYLAYGLGISSPIELAELVPGPAGTDVTIRLAPPPRWLANLRTEAQRVEIQPNIARFWFNDVGAFEVRNGREIDIIPEPGIEAPVLRLYVQGMILAMLLQQRGLCVLHASVVRIHGAAVALCGPVGAGKSTLAAALVRQGHELLSDDNAAVSLEPGTPMVASAYPFVKLYPEIASSLGFEQDEMRPLHRVQAKVAGAVSHRFRSSTAPLHRIFVLNRGSRAGASRLRESEAAIELVRHSVPTRWGHPAGAAHFRDCVDLARRVPAYSLRTFDKLSGIEAVTQAIVECQDPDVAVEGTYAAGIPGNFGDNIQPRL